MRSPKAAHARDYVLLLQTTTITRRVVASTASVPTSAPSHRRRYGAWSHADERVTASLLRMVECPTLQVVGPMHLHDNVQLVPMGALRKYILLSADIWVPRIKWGFDFSIRMEHISPIQHVFCLQSTRESFLGFRCS